MQIVMLRRLLETFQKFSERNALFIKGNYYTYQELADLVKAIMFTIKRNTGPSDKLIGIIATDDLETYASFLASWFAGVGFVPINPKIPYERNNRIIDTADISVVLSSKSDVSSIIDISKTEVVITKDLPFENTGILLPTIDDDQIMCILFTSGSTGEPKGVPMTLKNINTTLDSFTALGYNLNEHDGFLQMFEFTFDMSMLSYLPAFLMGACVYSVADAKVKYLSAVKLMQSQDITFAAMVPSTLTYLRPYFKELRLNQLKYSLLGGEPFTASLATEWAECIPNATIVNISGPTETTMACMGYTLNKEMSCNKAHNGILAFGRPWKNTRAIIIDEQLNPVPAGVMGELCFSGNNVMPGYWKMPEKNRDVFFRIILGKEEFRFYRTGDMAFMDEDGDYMTCGRIDQQVKVQGHRVELQEIEALVRKYTGIINVAAMATKDTGGFTQLYLFLEKYSGTSNKILDYLKTQLPWYMIPNEVIVSDSFPLNTNGKIDRVALLESLKERE
jgi:amino acid adenylation domain-containing protein